MGDMAKNIRGHLVGSTSITSLVPATNIAVSNSPLNIAGKQVVIKDIPGKSHPKLDLESGIITLMVVVDDSIAEPYSTCRSIVSAILTLLNKKDETLRNSYAQVRWFLKSGVEYIFNPEENYWMGVISFDYVEGGIVD